MDANFWIAMFKVLGGAGAFVAALAWLSKSLVSQCFKKDLEHFKSELQNAATLGVEQLRAHLTQLSKEHEVRFSLLHSKRAEIISELYEKIVDAYSHSLVLALGAEKTGVELHQQRAEAAWESFGTASKLLYARKIWLSTSLAQKVDRLLRELREPSFTYHYYLKEKRSENDVMEAAKAWATKRHDVFALIEDLEREFRSELSGARISASLSNNEAERTR